MPDLSTLQWIIAAAGVFALALGFFKTVMPRVRHVWHKAVGVMETIGGRDAIVDRATGRELVPAEPGIAETLHDMKGALHKLAEHAARTDEHATLLLDHDKRIKALEDARVERVVAQAESAHMWRAIADENEEQS